MKKIKEKYFLFPLMKTKKSSTLFNENSSRSILEKSESRQTIFYKPINPKHPFNPYTIRLNEIIKKNNLSLITNNKFKSIIIKFRNERKKKFEEKKVFYKNKSFYDYEEEKKTHHKMLKAMLKKDAQTLQFLLIQDQKKNLKKNNKLHSLKNCSFSNRKNSNSSNRNTSMVSPHNFLPEKLEKMSVSKSMVLGE